MKKHNISWQRIFVFFVIATIISNIFRFDIFTLRPELQKLPTWIYLCSIVLLEGSGVIIGALIIIPLLKKKREIDISFFGTSKSKSLIMMLIPIGLLTIIGVINDFGMNYHIYGFTAIIGSLVYCVMEEYGWRGYLQEELKFMKPWQKYLIIGIFWYVWHLTFLTSATIKQNLFFLAMMIFGSWGIGQVAEYTKSIAASACFHLIVQIMMLNSLFKSGFNGTNKMVILFICVTLWIIVLKVWKTEKQDK